MTRALPLAALALAACAPMAQPGAETASAEPAPEISEQTLKTVTEKLSSDEFEGRAPATHGEELAVQYISDQFGQAGLRPGNNGDWYQQVPLVELTADPDTARLSYSQGSETTALDYGDDMVLWTKRVTESVDVDDAEMVFVGYGINAPERGWNDYEGVDMHGKIAVILVNDPDYLSETNEGRFDGRAMTYYGRWTYKYEEAARQGAAGAIIVHETDPAAYGWNVVESSWTGPQLDMDAEDNHMDRVPVEGWVQHDVARAMFAAAGKDLRTLSTAARQPGFRAIPLGLTGSAHLDNSIRREMSRNVVGILPGTTRPEEYILYTAHWDHLGHCPPTRPATTFATVRSIMRAASPGLSRWRRPTRRRERPSARSSSSRSPARNRASWDRAIMPTIRCSRSPRLSAASTWTGST